MAEKDKDLKCSWDGDIATFPDYIRRVRLVFERTRRRRRKHLGPDLVAQLTGRAWVITQEIDHSLLTQKDGAHYLIRFLRTNWHGYQFLTLEPVQRNFWFASEDPMGCRWRRGAQR